MKSMRITTIAILLLILVMVTFIIQLILYFHHHHMEIDNMDKPSTMTNNYYNSNFNRRNQYQNRKQFPDMKDGEQMGGGIDGNYEQLTLPKVEDNGLTKEKIDEVTRPVTSNGIEDKGSKEANEMKGKGVSSEQSEMPLTHDSSIKVMTQPPNLHRQQHNHDQKHQYKPQREEASQPVRVAVLVIYVGPSLPVWFDAFLQSAAISSTLFDWKLLVTKAPLRSVPDNVQIIKLTEDELFSHFTKLVDSPLPYPYDTAGVIKHLLTTKSYCMVEFKPSLGYVLSDYIVGYSHWAYADIDQLLGRMHSLIPVSILQSYDIYTSTFGDNFRMYMRGQLTIHQNTPKATMLYKDCPHFVNFRELLIRYVQSGNRSWSFESAEGCYSKIVSDARIHKNVSVYFGATQATDAFGAPASDRESILFNNHLLRCYTAPLSQAFIQGRTNIENSFVQHHGIEYGSPRLDYSEPYLTIELKEYRCSYWVKPEYEVCLDVLPAYVDLEAKNGVVRYQDVDHYRAFNNTCRESAISHFQGWKRNYLMATTHAAPADAHALILAEFGFIPLRLTNVGPEVKTFGELLAPKLSTMGRLTSTHISEIGLKRSLSGGLHGMNIRYDQDDIASAYCGAFSSDLNKCVCTLLSGDFFIAHIAENFDKDERSLTFITAAWADDFYSGALDDTLNAWSNSQKVVVLARAEPVKARPEMHRLDCTVIEVSFASCVDHIDDFEHGFSLPDNILYNVGLDAAATDLVCVVPAGVVLDLPPKLPSNAWSDSLSSISSAGLVAMVMPVYIPWQSLSNLERAQWSHEKQHRAQIPLADHGDVVEDEVESGDDDDDDEAHGQQQNKVLHGKKVDKKKNGEHEDNDVEVEDIESHLTRHVEKRTRSKATERNSAKAESLNHTYRKPVNDKTKSDAGTAKRSIETRDQSALNHKSRGHDARDTVHSGNDMSSDTKRHVSTKSVHSDASSARKLTHLNSSNAAIKPRQEKKQEASRLRGPEIGLQPEVPYKDKSRSQRRQLLSVEHDSAEVNELTKESTVDEIFLQSRVKSFPRRNITDAASTCAEVGTEQSDNLYPVFSQNYQTKSRLVAHISRLHFDRHFNKSTFSLFHYDEQGNVDSERVKFRAVEFNHRQTAMLPFLFNVTATPHGSRFLRFPEELSGVGCYGTSILRILVGSGYTPIWSSVIGFYHTYNKKTHEQQVTGKDKCSCLYGEDEKLEHAVGKMNNFYLRAVHVRKYGLQGIYAKPEYGLNFQEEQLKLMAEAQDAGANQ